MNRILLIVLISGINFLQANTIDSCISNVDTLTSSNITNESKVSIDTGTIKNEKDYNFFDIGLNKYVKGNEWYPYNQKRVNKITYGQIIGYSANFATLYHFWYKDYPKSNFHFFNDWDEYLQVDKVSHLYGTYIGGRMSMQLWKWAGAPKRKYIWIGAMTGLYYETVIEIMDGVNKQWGFSKGDYAFNLIGAGILVGQELLWNEQKISVKYGTHLATYSDPDVDYYLNRIYGSTKIERLFKDYNPQTYWLSFNLKSFFKKSNLPNWLNIAVGYGGENMMGALWNGILRRDPNFPNDRDKEVKDESPIFQRYRQYFLAPDIDLTRIKTKSKLLKTVLFVLNSFKFPTPSLELSKGSIKFNWLTF